MTKTYITITILTTMFFQFGLTYFTGISLQHDTGLWSVITIAYSVALPFWSHPLDDWIHFQITLHKERAQRRRNYELFRDGVKSGLIATDEQFNDEARKVIK